MTRVAIAADSHLTAAAGARIARQGGNVVDVAVGSALAATVSEVLMCSLGGAGFFMVRMPGGDAELIEGADAFPTMSRTPELGTEAWRKAWVPYGDGVEVMGGYASISVPGVLAAAEMVWQRHGSLPWKEIVAPALELASRPIPVSTTMAGWLALAGPNLLSGQAASRACFFRDGQPLPAGQKFQIPNLDQTWQAISEQGAQTLYDGDLAARFADEVIRHGGFVDRNDLATYEAMVRKPLSILSGGFEVALNPPPAAGGAAVGYLIRCIESTWDARSTAAHQVVMQAKAQLGLQGERNDRLYDAGFDHDAATHWLAAAGSGPLNAPGTTHISVVDVDGGMVSITMSMGYGSGIVIPELGIACNNSLGEPELNPLGFHAGIPGTRIGSNMAPMVAWHSDGRCLALGSPGASRITTSIAQTWLHVVLDGKTYEEAVAAPRIHIEACDDELRAQYEPGVDTSQLGEPLVLRPFDAADRYFGGVKLAGLDDRGQLHAVADSRRDGAVEFID
ncbi:MAG: gamma-glutamyltransferase [Pirellulaceae bacterium]